MRKEYPFGKAGKPKPTAFDQYYGELTTLGPTGLSQILDRGKEWEKEIGRLLSQGGGAIFPHTYMSQCGYQMAAVIQGILASGADQVLLLGTAHGFPGKMVEGRLKELNGEDVAGDPTWGVLDPVRHKDLLQWEFSLNLFKALWKLELERRGIKGPRLIERYPCLTNRRPDLLPGMDELKRIAQDAVIVGTMDYCHHGIAYGLQNALPMNEKALQFAKGQIEKGNRLLAKGDYAAYFEHGFDPNALDDPTDVPVAIHYLTGNAPKMLDLKLVDVSPLFEQDPEPSWVAVALMTL